MADPITNLPDYATTITTRDLSTDNKINIIIGVLTIVIGILSAMLAWSTWRLTKERRRLSTKLSK